MTDELESQEEQAAAAEAEGPVCGERLAEARRELQISILDIAKELHLDEPKVRALEKNEFDVLGAPVFAKGHLKTYAQLVNVDADDVLVDYYQLTRAAPSVPPVVSSRPKPGKELAPGPWITLVIIIIIVATAFWWFTRPPQPVTDAPADESPPAETAPAEIPQDEPPSQAAGEDTAEQTVEQPAEQTAPRVVEPVVVDEPEPEAEAQDDPVVEAGQMHVLITYTGDCWTEITDATGRRLMYDLGRDGRTVELRGAEPFSVKFGSPANVSLRVNGEERALPPTNRPDRPMNLTLSSN